MTWATPEPAGAAESGWEPRPARGGHFGAVVDMCWGADGACLMTSGADQTARIFSACGDTWCEIARPQVRFRV